MSRLNNFRLAGCVHQELYKGRRSDVALGAGPLSISKQLFELVCKYEEPPIGTKLVAREVFEPSAAIHQDEFNVGDLRVIPSECAGERPGEAADGIEARSRDRSDYPLCAARTEISASDGGDQTGANKEDLRTFRFPRFPRRPGIADSQGAAGVL